MGATVHDVAAAVIEAQNAAGRSIDKMQLQKLLYLIQGAHIRYTGHPAFRADFLAYKNGPVVEQVESSYRNAVDGLDSIRTPIGGKASKLDPELRHTVDAVLEIYGGWDAPNLERHTKRAESPWRVARRGIPAGASSREPIPLSDIARWFVTHPVEPTPKEVRDLPPELAEREREADEDIAAGRVRSFDGAEDFLANLG